MIGQQRVKGCKCTHPTPRALFVEKSRDERPMASQELRIARVDRGIWSIVSVGSGA